MAVFPQTRRRRLDNSGIRRSGLVGYWETRSAYQSGMTILPKFGSASLTVGDGTAENTYAPIVGSGYSTLNSTSTDDYFELASAITMPIPWTAYLFIHWRTGAGYNWFLGSGGNWWALYRASDTKIRLAQKSGGSYSNTGDYNGPIADNLPLCMWFDGTNHYLRDLRSSSVLSATTRSDIAAGAYNLRIGCNGSTAAVQSEVGAAALYTGAHNSAQQNQLYRYMTRHEASLMPPFDWATKTGNLIVFDGDSLTDHATYPNAVVAGLTGTWEKVNHGTSGADWSDLVAEGATVDTFYGPLRDNAILCVLCGSNDWSYSNEITYPKVVAYCQARQAAGWKVVIGTVPPCALANELRQGYREALNASIVANYTTFADALADFSADEHIGLSSATYLTQPDYFLDSKHMTTLGYTLLAAYFETAVETLL